MTLAPKPFKGDVRLGASLDWRAVVPSPPGRQVCGGSLGLLSGTNRPYRLRPRSSPPKAF